MPDNKLSDVLVYVNVNRYNDLIEIEKKSEKKTVYIHKNWGFSGTTDTVYTDDEAIKELAKDLKLAQEKNEKLTKDLSEANSKIYELEMKLTKAISTPWYKKL